jgi:malonyl-CoA/methylmalonyl-CoA synthetase
MGANQRRRRLTPVIAGASVAGLPLSFFPSSPLLDRLGAARASGASVGGIDYTALRARAAAIASALCGGRADLAGQPVAFLTAPGTPYAELLLGIVAAGGTAVPLSPLHTERELATIVEDAGAPLVIAAATLAERATAAAAAVSSSSAAIAAAPARVISPDALLASAGAPDTPDGSRRRPALPPDAPAIMLYTSGTTGRPKGVVLSHAAVAATLASLESAWRWRADDRLLHALPLHHTHGVIVALLGALWAGATVRFSAFEAAAIWDQLADRALGITLFMGVPTMYAKLLDTFRDAPPARRSAWRDGARRLRLFTSGSAALPATVLDDFRAATGQTILERYGMTEIGMALSNAYDGPRVPGAVGVPLPAVAVDIVGDDGTAAPDGQPGEGGVGPPPRVYRDNADPAATAASFDAAGRFRTGDTGVRDPATGVIRLLGRTSVDVLKSGGYKISALEIEAALRDHPAVADLAVIGVPDPTLTWGDLVTACVVLKAGASLTLDELKAFARDRLAVYKIPRALRVLPALPRNAMGKVQKKQLLAGADRGGA